MRIRVNGVSLFFEVEESKLVPSGRTFRERPTLVALHGGPGIDHTDLRAGLARLGGRAQVVYLDQRGNGRSDRSAPEHWNLATWADATLLLAGEEDVVFPTPCADALVAGIPPNLLRFERFLGCGHALLSDCPERVCDAIASFVDARP